MISIIIPVRDQLHYTKQILADIPKKIKGDYEIIVVDDHSVDGTAEYLYEYARTIDINICMFGDKWVNAAWNAWVAHAKGEYVFIINNDLILTEWLDIELRAGLKNAKIACPYTTVGKDKFMLPLTKKEDMIAGWCFMMKKSDWVPIDGQLDIWFGDNWIYEKTGRSVFYGGICHHYESKTLFAPEIREEIDARLKRDKEVWNEIAVTLKH